MTNPKSIVLYDGECPFCQKSVAILRRLDWLKRLEYRNARDMAGWPACAEPLNLDRMLEEMHVVTPDGQRAYAGYRAFRWIAGRLPLCWPIWPFLYLPGVPWLGQKAYLWVATNRYNLVPCHDGQCAVPLVKK